MQGYWCVPIRFMYRTEFQLAGARCTVQLQTIIYLSYKNLKRDCFQSFNKYSGSCKRLMSNVFFSHKQRLGEITINIIFTKT